MRDFLNNLDTIPSFDTLHHILSLDFQEYFYSQPSLSHTMASSSYTLEPETSLVEISPGKSLHISSYIVTLLQDHLNAFPWSYEDMKGISPKTCTHNIYIQEGAQPIQ